MMRFFARAAAAAVDDDLVLPPGLALTAVLMIGEVPGGLYPPPLNHVSLPARMAHFRAPPD